MRIEPRQRIRSFAPVILRRSALIASGWMISFSALSAQEAESVWVTGVTGSAAVRSGTAEVAKQRARVAAVGEALKKLGIPFNPERFEVQAEAGRSAEDLRRANDAFLLILRGRSGGFVSGVRNITSDVREQSGTILCTTTLDARITRPQGAPDHRFYVNLAPAAKSVRIGDPIRIRATPSREAFLYLFHIMADGVRLLYPPAIDSDLPLPAGSEIAVPLSAGSPWVAGLPEGWESSEELIIAVATTTKIPDGRSGILNPDGYGSAREGALMELMGWLSALPLNEVTESSLRVEIVRN
jgi:hypothetical protein